MNNLSQRIIILSLFNLVFLAQATQADILISPNRAVLDESNRQAVISLHNPGSSARTYRLKWVERRMDEGGQLSEIKDGENARSIANMVRFSPRQVEVAPGQTQTIRLDYRPPSSLAAGEYRSHLRIGLQPPADGKGGTPAISGKHEGMSFQLNALLSFTVPIIVRQGAGSVDVKITSIQPTMIKRNNTSEPALKVSLARTGEHSSYGKIMIYQQTNTSDPIDLIGETGGIAMYTEVKEQTREVILRPGVKLQPGSWLRISYEGEGLDRGKIYDEQTLQIGN